MGGGNSAKLQDADKRITALPPLGGFVIARWALFDAYSIYMQTYRMFLKKSNLTGSMSRTGVSLMKRSDGVILSNHENRICLQKILSND